MGIGYPNLTTGLVLCVEIILLLCESPTDLNYPKCLSLVSQTTRRPNESKPIT